MYIDNHHLNLFKENKTLELNFGKPKLGNIICFGEFISMDNPGAEVKENLFFGTTLGFIIAVNLETKAFTFCRIMSKENEKIMSINIFENSIIVHSDYNCFLCSIDYQKYQIKK